MPVSVHARFLERFDATALLNTSTFLLLVKTGYHEAM